MTLFDWLNRPSISMPARYVLSGAVVSLAPLGIASGQSGMLTQCFSGECIQAVRSIDDPQSGLHWLLVRDPTHPDGPGHLVSVLRPEGKEQQPSTLPQNAAMHFRKVLPPLPVVIRGGDSLIVEDAAGYASASLEAVALGPAAVGSEFQAKLRIGGAVVRVVALAPGRAEIAVRIEVRQ
jgi:hypothetical protein